MLNHALRCTKLCAQLANTMTIISQYTQNQLGIRMQQFNLVQLICIIKSHLAYILTGGKLDMRRLLGRIRVDDLLRLNSQIQHSLYLAFTGAIKSNTFIDKCLQNTHVGIAFDCVEGRHSRQLHLPSHMLPDNLTKISHKEGILLSIAIINLLDLLRDDGHCQSIINLYIANVIALCIRVLLYICFSDIDSRIYNMFIITNTAIAIQEPWRGVE